jgi:hypothetical protein
LQWYYLHQWKIKLKTQKIFTGFLTTKLKVGILHVTFISARVLSFISTSFGIASATLFKQGLVLESSPKIVHNKIRDIILALLKKEIQKTYKLPLVVTLIKLANLP